MRSLLLALSLLLVACSAAQAAPLPWKTFPEMGADVAGMDIGACPGNGQGPVEAMMVTLVKDGVSYSFFATADRWVLAKLDAHNRPVYIWAGEVDERDRNAVKASKESPYDPAVWPSPCVWLAPQGA